MELACNLEPGKRVPPSWMRVWKESRSPGGGDVGGVWGSRPLFDTPMDECVEERAAVEGTAPRLLFYTRSGSHLTRRRYRVLLFSSAMD